MVMYVVLMVASEETSFDWRHVACTVCFNSLVAERDGSLLRMSYIPDGTPEYMIGRFRTCIPLIPLPLTLWVV